MKKGEKICLGVAFVLAFFNSAFLGEIRQIRSLQRQLRTHRAAMIETTSISSRELRYDGSIKRRKTQKKKKLGRRRKAKKANNTLKKISSPPPKDAPLFVLHIGPPKTGTTTIQWAGRNYPGLMKKDNFYFVGNQQNVPEKLLHEMVRNCRDWIEPACQSKWNEFKGIIESHLKNKHNVFMSEEMLNVCAKAENEDYSLWDRLIPILEGWNVRIVYTYRRLHEWVPSKYHQAFSFDVPDHRKESRDNWPDNGGRVISSFSAFFDTLMVKRSFLLPLAVAKRWKERFPHSEIRVFDMHATIKSDKRSTNNLFLSSFFCQVMPEAERLCQHLTEQKSKEDTFLNPSESKCHHYDMLAVGAYQKGMIKTNMTRKDATDAVESHALNRLGLSKLSDFPLDCITPQQSERLLNQTLEYEKEMVPDRYESEESEIRRQFAEATESGKFCSVNVEKTLQHPKWQGFFKSLQ